MFILEENVYIDKYYADILRMPQSQTADQPIARQEQYTEHRQPYDSKDAIKVKQPALFPSRK